MYPWLGTPRYLAACLNPFLAVQTLVQLSWSTPPNSTTHGVLRSHPVMGGITLAGARGDRPRTRQFCSTRAVSPRGRGSVGSLSGVTLVPGGALPGCPAPPSSMEYSIRKEHGGDTVRTQPHAVTPS